MPNISISELPDALLPLVGATTFFEVEATEGGVVVSRRVAADNLVISATTLFIDGTSTDDPAVGGGVFDGQLLWRNANAQQTGVFGFDPAGDNFIWSNDAELGFHQIAIRDGTVLVETIAAAAGGLLVNNLLTGAGLERVLTIADIFQNVFIGTSTDDPTVFGGTFDGVADWQNANLLDTGAVGFDPAGDAFRVFNKTRGGDIALRVISTTPAEIDIYFYDGAAGQHLWRDNSANDLMELRAGFNAVTLIAQQNNLPSGGFAQVGQFRIEISNGGDPSATFGFPESGAASTILTIKQFVHGGQIRLVAEDNAGAEQITFLGDPDGVSQLYFAGVLNLRTLLASAGGVEINNLSTGGGFERVLTSSDLFTGVFIGTSTDDPTVFGGTFDATAEFQNSLFAATATVGFDPAGDDFRVYNRVHGGTLSLRGERASGVVVDAYSIDFNSGQQLWTDVQNAFKALQLLSTDRSLTKFGNIVGAPSAGLAQEGQFRIANIGDDTAGVFGFAFPASTAMDIKNFVHGGPVRIVVENLAGGAERVLGVFDPDTGIILRNQDNTTVFTTVVEASGGVEVLNTVTGGGLERVLTIGDLFTGGLNSLSDVTLTAPATGSVLFKSAGDWLNTPAITIDPAGAVEVFHNAALTLRTVVAGIDVVGDSTTNSEITLFATDGSTALASIHHVAGGLRIEPDVNNESVSIFSRSSGGALQQSFQAVNSGIAQIYHLGLIRILTQTQGMTVRGNAAANAQLLIEGSGGVDMLTIACSSTIIQFVSELDGSVIRFRGSDTGASIRTLWDADPDGDFNAYRVGALRAGTRFDGWRILGLLSNVPASGGTQDVSLEFQNLVGTIAGAVRYNTSIDMRIENFVHGGSILVLAEDAGGTLRFLLDMSPDGPNSIQLHEVGVAVARTVTAANGGLEANNLSTGAGFERVLTTADRTDASAYTLNAVVVQDRTLLASASATILNNNNVLAALITDLQSAGIIQ